MQQHERPAQRILGLLEGYPAMFGGDGEVGAATAHQQWVRRQLDMQPGRWFLVGESRHLGGGRKVRSGPQVNDFTRGGYEAQALNGNVYARAPHPDGRPLTDYVTPRKPWSKGDALPELADDKFGWSKSEINDALAMARAWLFPTEGIAAA